MHPHPSPKTTENALFSGVITLTAIAICRASASGPNGGELLSQLDRTSHECDRTGLSILGFRPIPPEFARERHRLVPTKSCVSDGPKAANQTSMRTRWWTDLY